MQPKKIKLAYLGSRPVSLKALKLLIQLISNYPEGMIDLSVVTKSDDSPPLGVVKWWDVGALSKFARKMKLKVIDEKELVDGNFDLMISVFYNDIIPKKLIDSIPRGIINFHFGYLPDQNFEKQRRTGDHSKPYSRGTYRGSNILSFPIINNESWQAVTLHYVSEMIDLGPVIEHSWNKIEDTTTAWDLQKMSDEKVLYLLKKYFPKLINSEKKIPAIPAGTGKYKYHNRDLLNRFKILDPDTPVSKLKLITRAVAFPNAEPAYFLHKAKGKLLKEYVVFAKKRGITILPPREETYIQRLRDL